ncbi:DUF2877 domain-containing protein [Carnobacterium sp.]|uniref:DUF2877 domain-containing protein n=1 Tax=Carnobacterium sp. TaxID=48221 RepID=UPI00388DDA26
MFEKAILFDEALRETLFSTSEWSVQSVFDKSINLQNEKKNELILVCGLDYPKLPHAIYVEKECLQSLIKTTMKNERVKITSGWVRIGKTQLSLHNSDHYSSVFESESKLNSASVKKLFGYLHQVTDLNGFSFPLSELGCVKDFNSRWEMDALKKIVCGIEREQTSGIDYLLGRGKGLTPSGDDMLIGCLAADLFYKRLNSYFKKTLKLKLHGEPVLTTTVSIHYLNCALQKKWNEPIHHLIQVLSNDSTENEIEEIIQNIIRIGHTSGLDMLTGFAATMILFDKNEGGRKWLNV